MSLIKLECASSLEKIFPDEPSKNSSKEMKLSTLLEETVSFQIVYYYDAKENKLCNITVKSPLAQNIIVREVILSPSSFPCYCDTDEGYLRTKPGLFPDLLRRLNNQQVKMIGGQWRSLWIDVETEADTIPGTYPITVEFSLEDGSDAEYITAEIEIIGTKLPKLHIKHTEWFHADCLADYYHVEACSQEHFDIIEAFIKNAKKRDINMILVPQFTPPLDTAVGGERTTMQLVDVQVKHGVYKFNFTNMKLFIDICMKNGIQYLEMSHLFTQWGAKAAPKVMATVDGEYKRIFGWDTPATRGEYENFLRCYLPQLTEKLKEWGVADITYFHLSDEPHKEHIGFYREARELVKPYLEEFQMIDAMSDYNFYESGLIEQPICATDYIEPFLEHKVPDLWSYYCTSEFLKVSNRFMSMASYRNRVYGLQVYTSGVTGILHWAYNFYNTQFSLQKVNPYLVTDCGNAFPSGDSFLVYPGDNRQPEESIRIMVLYEAMTDIRALKLLENLTCREHVQELIQEGLNQLITFSEYPHNPTYYLTLRAKVNEEIAKTSKLVNLKTNILSNKGIDG